MFLSDRHESGQTPWKKRRFFDGIHLPREEDHVYWIRSGKFKFVKLIELHLLLTGTKVDLDSLGRVNSGTAMPGS